MKLKKKGTKNKYQLVEERIKDFIGEGCTLIADFLIVFAP